MNWAVYTHGNIPSAVLGRSFSILSFTAGPRLGGKHSVLLNWHLRATVFCLIESAQLSFLWWIPVLPLCFAPLTQQLHPHPNHLASVSVHLKPEIQLMNAQFVWRREESIIVGCALDLHKNGFTLAKGIDITSEWSLTHMSSFVVALLVSPFKNWSLSVQSSVLSIWVIAVGPLTEEVPASDLKSQQTVSILCG